MFSKPLFKQSCKAHGVMWGIITFATCFMLACVMLIAGNSNLKDTVIVVQNTIIQGEIKSQMQSRSINYYEISGGALEAFDEAFGDEIASLFPQIITQKLTAEEAAAAAYRKAVDALDGEGGYIETTAAALGYEKDSTQAQEIRGAVMYVLNPQGMFDDFYVKFGETPPAYDVAGLTTVSSPEERAAYRKEYAANNAVVFLAGNMLDDANVDKMLEALSEYGVTAKQYEEFGYKDYATVKDIAVSALIDYRAKFAYEIERAETTGKTEAEIKAELTKDVTKSLLASLPQEVSDALQEIGQMDMYSTLVGSIFFKMAGLLLPIIYLIMTANALVAGQVDSGSMAYVLSSSVKRREVTFTQAAFLVLSLFAMFACTTLTSVICLAIVKTEEITLTYGNLILMNLGAFLVLFAMSGFCFFASCLFNRGKYSMALGGGVTMFFLVATMLGLFGSTVLPSVVRIGALNAFNYVSVISLFDVISILEGSLTFLWKFAILAVAGIALYVAGSEKFARKDLPL